jgi:ribosomal protein S18 acetylase RimI-like enzyme
LIAAGERRHGGRVVTAVDAVAANLARPTLDLTRDTLLVYDPPGELVGWSWMHIGKRAEVHVHPDHEGCGLGTRLLAWTESQARAAGSHDLGQTVNDANTAATALMHAHGYRPKATQWRLEIDLPTAEPAVPRGIEVRPFLPGDELATYRMAEDAFMDWQERHRSFEEWSQLTIARDMFAPALSPLALDGERLVGAVLSLDRPGSEGHVERVAVDREYRRRGIAQALLRQAFASFARVGKRTCALWTHSETGALGLYERAGMTVRHSSTHVRKPLTRP